MTFLDALKPLRDDFKTISLPDSPSVVEAERAMDLQAGLAGPRKMGVRVRRKSRDLRQQASAIKHLDGLPKRGEAWHCLIDGTYSLWDLVPAIHRIAGKIKELFIATLSFSKGNIESMLGMFDAGQIGKITLLCSHYFSATSKEIYDDAAVGFAARKEQRFASVRTHAKVMAIRMSTGARYAIESSANLRSCKNVEQFVIINHPRLFNFHRDWITELA